MLTGKNIKKVNELWGITIYNCIVVITWATLAVIFDKWGIALISVLFLARIQTKLISKSFRLCDRCGKRSPVADNPEQAIAKAEQLGWLHINEGDLDYCPECRKEVEITNGH